MKKRVMPQRFAADKMLFRGLRVDSVNFASKVLNRKANLPYRTEKESY
jgi:hypothetical protein